MESQVSTHGLETSTARATPARQRASTSGIITVFGLAPRGAQALAAASFENRPTLRASRPRPRGSHASEARSLSHAKLGDESSQSFCSAERREASHDGSIRDRSTIHGPPALRRWSHKNLQHPQHGSRAVHFSPPTTPWVKRVRTIDPSSASPRQIEQSGIGVIIGRRRGWPYGLVRTVAKEQGPAYATASRPPSPGKFTLT